jgi:hypothetical protein
VFVVIDIENFLRSSKTFHQSRELIPVDETFSNACIAADLSPRLSTFERCWLRGAMGAQRPGDTRDSFALRFGAAFAKRQPSHARVSGRSHHADAVTHDGNPR